MQIDGVWLCTLLQHFGLKECKPIATPMEIGLRLSLHDVGDAFDVVLYQHAVGCLF